jgi:hypothetical protein
MSIVALKRKSERFIKPISGANSGPSGSVFSLNGGYRNQRAFGNTNLAQLKKSAELCYANNPAIIKRSTLSERGYIFENLWYPTCTGNGGVGCSPQNNWTKTMQQDNLTRSQGIYITNLINSQSGGSNCPPMYKFVPASDVDNCTSRKKYRIGGKLICQNVFAKNTGCGAVPSSEYMRTGLMNQNCLPTPAYAQPFPVDVTTAGCNGVTVTTPAQAIKQHILPPNWTGIA